jgi:hypothetical protein
MNIRPGGVGGAEKGISRASHPENQGVTPENVTPEN